ncbi:MAG: histidine phosphatase family protein [Longicatena sp.]
MSIYFVRHGQTDWNKEGKMQGRGNVPLNETGRMQALETKKKLEHITIDKIYSSPLDRAFETAEIINQNWGLAIQQEDRLIERSFGTYEGNTIDGVNFKKLWSYSNISPFKEGEDSISFYKRVESFLDEIIEDAQHTNILLVAHGGVSIPYRCYFEGYDHKKDLHDYLLGNCEVSHMTGKKFK